MEETIFSKIIRKEIPTNKLYEDDLFFSFLDISPATLGHALVIPKKQFVDMRSVDGEYLKEYLGVVQKIANAILEATGIKGYKILNNAGECAGQTVFHVHMHIIPIDEDHPFSPNGNDWQSHPYLHEGDNGKQLAEKVRSILER